MPLPKIGQIIKGLYRIDIVFRSDCEVARMPHYISQIVAVVSGENRPSIGLIKNLLHLVARPLNVDVKFAIRGINDLYNVIGVAWRYDDTDLERQTILNGGQMRVGVHPQQQGQEQCQWYYLQAFQNATLCLRHTPILSGLLGQ